MARLLFTNVFPSLFRGEKFKFLMLNTLTLIIASLSVLWYFRRKGTIFIPFFVPSRTALHGKVNPAPFLTASAHVKQWSNNTWSQRNWRSLYKPRATTCRNGKPPVRSLINYIIYHCTACPKGCGLVSKPILSSRSHTLNWCTYAAASWRQKSLQSHRPPYRPFSRWRASKVRPCGLWSAGQCAIARLRCNRCSNGDH